MYLLSPLQTAAMSQDVHDMFARIAKRYDMANRLLSAGRDVAWRKHALGMLDGKDHCILDLACGTFDLSRDALSTGKAKLVHGADFCAPMLHAGNHKRSQLAITACAGDGMALPYADASFDVAIMAYGWRNIDKPEQCLSELRRVLKPDGQIMLLEFFKPCTWWPRLFYGTFGRFIFPLIGGLVSGDSSAYRYLRTSIQGFYSVHEAEAALKQSGFDRIRWKSFFGGISHAVTAHVGSA